ncbi:MAG: glutamine--tRNA ligase/YqeY domain fusion protein [Planctomycetota bacterium]|nr:glutamine--tRNA ligase/YqeY domain fusion protein [Planctomycetota bacterium]
MSIDENSRSLNFVEQAIEQDNQTSRFQDQVITRFPPEPNGYLHIGHAKSICLNFGIAQRYGGHCNLRFDDTNPTREDTEYVQSIETDVQWLGFSWPGQSCYASDYFGQLFEWAIQLIDQGQAYVCDLTPEKTREYRGTLTQPGRNSPNRDRSPKENKDLFNRMRNGEFPDGSRTLRARIDMASPNINLRDPVMYRILHATHHRTGDNWCIYPMYDFTHGQSDSIEGVTHSICTMEFENHRPLYDWYLQTLGVYHPQQIEFARLNLSHTVLSKRKLIELVEQGHVDGWDDPRMPTLCGLRRRGYTPASIRHFCERIGVAKYDSLVDISWLEQAVREDLNQSARRAMVVMDPVKLIIDNYPEGQSESLEAVNNPEDPSAGKRQIPFSRELYIERSDFQENPPKKYHRLYPGKEVRLRYAYLVTCTECVKDPETGEITEVHCTYDPQTRGGSAPDGRKVRGTIHWVSAGHAAECTIRLYDHLFATPAPLEDGEDKDYREHINPQALTVLDDARLEPDLLSAKPGDHYQFERVGYFCVDSEDSEPGKPVFNRTATLRDRWSKVQKKSK